MITSMINLLDVAGLKAIDVARAVPKTVYGAATVLTMVSVSAVPAQAETVTVTASNNPASYIGCPTLSFLAPVQQLSQDLTGTLTGAFIVIAMLALLVAGVALAFAGRRQDRAAGAIESGMNVLKGVGFVCIGIPLFAALVWGIAIGFNPACA
jgi:hypothetical protein